MYVLPKSFPDLGTTLCSSWLVDLVPGNKLPALGGQ